MLAGNKFKHKSLSGFTLIEILLVVLIIGIMTAVGANIVNSQSAERTIMNAAAQFEAELKYLCDLSVLENRAHGIEWTENGRQWLTYHQGDWVLSEAHLISESVPFKQQILLQGREQILLPKAEELPHVICQNDGSFNAFEVRWFLDEGDQSAMYYAMKTESPWQLMGAWSEK